MTNMVTLALQSKISMIKEPKLKKIEKIKKNSKIFETIFNFLCFYI